jgi:hypothetical protein
MAIGISDDNDLLIGGYFEDSVDFNIGAAENYHFSQNNNTNMFLTQWGNCDNIVTQINQTTCFEYSSPSGSMTYTILGIYLDSLTSVFGCYSVVEINGSLNQINLNISENGRDFTADQSGGTYQWLNCHNDFAIIAGTTSQSFTPQIGINYAVEVGYNGCIDTTYCVNLTNIGIDFTDQAPLVLHPNPTKAGLSLRGDLITIREVQISDISGKLICSPSINLENGELDFKTALHAGVYIMYIETNQAIRTLRFVVE